MNKKRSPLVLIVLDGWGLNPEKTGNAIAQARTPTIDMLAKNYPHATLQASGISVGLYWSANGNSEVGHLTMGTGRVIYQSFPRISISVEDGSFFENKELLGAIEHAKKNNQPLHIMGLISNGGVHSHIDHVFALIKTARENKIPLRIHFFTDGRDTKSKQALEFVKKIEENIKDLPNAKIATIMGRSISMDRNNHWELTQKAYECLTKGEGEKFKSAKAAIEASYKKDITDEFMLPAVINPQKDDLIVSESSVIFFNFREDRARQLTKAFIQDGFNGFLRDQLKNLYFAGMIEYEKDLLEHIMFPPQIIKNPLAKVLSDNGLKQYHIAETEKYAHVTYFFNGGVEEPNHNEDWQLIPSRPDGDYENHPLMSASQITATVEKVIEKNIYDFILINYANTDMVGHTGNLKSAIRAVEEIDKCLDQLLKTGLQKNISFIITADHGNAENMIDPRTAKPRTDHTANPVPVYFVIPDHKAPQANASFNYNRSIGLLADLAPTILDLFDIKKPTEMTGMSLKDRIR